MGKQPGHADFETNPQSSQFEFLPDRNQLEKNRSPEPMAEEEQVGWVVFHPENRWCGNLFGNWVV